MADTTDILGLRIPSADGSDPADLATIIGDLGADVDASVGNPSLTTTQINALTGSAKAAGRRVWDSTLGVEKVSNGTTWVTQAALDSSGNLPMGAKKVTGMAAGTASTDAATKGQMDAAVAAAPYLPSAGGTLTGDLIFDNDSVDGHKIMFRQSGIDGWRILADTGGVFAIQRRDPSTGAYVDNPLLIEASGNVASRSHIGGSASGSTNLAGYLTKTVIAPPTGKSWSVTCNATRADTGAPLTVVGIPTSSTQVTFTCHWANAAYQGAVQIEYHLIAY